MGSVCGTEEETSKYNRKRIFNAVIHLLTLDSVMCGTFLDSRTVADVTVQSKMQKPQSLLSRSLYSSTVA